MTDLQEIVMRESLETRDRLEALGSSDVAEELSGALAEVDALIKRAGENEQDMPPACCYALVSEVLKWGRKRATVLLTEGGNKLPRVAIPPSVMFAIGEAKTDYDRLQVLLDAISGQASLGASKQLATAAWLCGPASERAFDIALELKSEALESA